MAKTKRDAIWEAALELFAQKGIDSTTTREIAERADTAEGNIYRHFKNKDDLIQQLFEESAATFHASLVEAADAETDPEARLRRLLRGIFKFADEKREVFAFLVTAPHADFVRDRDADWRPLPMRLFAGTLQEGHEAGVFRKVDPVLATGWIVAMTQRAIILSRTPMVTMSKDEVMEQTIDAALRVVAVHAGNEVA
ncbi:MAG: TetR/AcrR family transcriptional regulator [Rhodothermales bacterium]